jgi:large subunit ribosomal protein L23
MGKVNDPFQIIRVPLLTEKAHDLKELAASQVVFRVARDANKSEIKAAVERIFKAKVAAVNVINVAGKEKRLGRNVGRRSDWKKAIVTLKPGEKIEIIEGVS